MARSLRAYAFTDHKTGEDDRPKGRTRFTFIVTDVAAAEAEAAGVDGAGRRRVLHPRPGQRTRQRADDDDFAARLAAMHELGVEVEVLEEDELAQLGMGALLGVGQGSESPSKVVVMQWKGGGEDERRFALVGKGVVFDTGGISIKPAAGMEDMTMDMGGAGVVAGVMRTLALRKAKANVVGLVGLVENMPDGRAQRPGDVVRIDEGRHDRGDQHRRRGPPGAGRRAVVRAGTLQADRR